MATTDRYYPTGFMGTEKAILRLVKARYPQRWGIENMSEVEAGVWNGINITFSGLALDPHLPITVSEGEHKAAYERLLDFSEALSDLRKALHSGAIVAHFCDENGLFDTIKSQGWGGDAAIEILLTGVAYLDYGHEFWTRLVLIKETDVAALIGEGTGAELPVPSVPPDPAPAAEIFRKPRAPRSKDSDIVDQVTEIRGYRIAIDLIKRDHPHAGQNELARLAAGHLKNDKLKERLKQIIGGRHDLSNRLMDEGFLLKWVPGGG